jgi:hypothetical protein
MSICLCHSHRHIVFLSLMQACHEVSKQYFFTEWDCQPHTQTPTPNPQPGGPGHPLLSGSITFDLSGMGDPTSSCATTSIALRIIWPHKLHCYVKVGMPSGGMTVICTNILTFIFDNLYSMLYMSSTLVAPSGWLQFAGKTCRSFKNQLCS